MLKDAFNEGVRTALYKFAAPAIPASISKSLAAGSKPPAPAEPVSRLGIEAAKVAANVGLGYSNSSPGGTGAVRGEPADAGRRQRSVIDRAFQQNDDFFATSSMPMPGNVSP